MGIDVGYIRTSSLSQEPSLQIASIKALGGNNELMIYQEKLSAWKDNVKRPVLLEIIDLIKKGKIDNLYVWDLDRIYRNRIRLKEFFLLCKINNV